MNSKSLVSEGKLISNSSSYQDQDFTYSISNTYFIPYGEEGELHLEIAEQNEWALESRGLNTGSNSK